MEFPYVAPLQGMRHYKVKKKSLECLKFGVTKIEEKFGVPKVWSD